MLKLTVPILDVDVKQFQAFSVYVKHVMHCRNR